MGFICKLINSHKLRYAIFDLATLAVFGLSCYRFIVLPNINKKSDSSKKNENAKKSLPLSPEAKRRPKRRESIIPGSRFV